MPRAIAVVTVALSTWEVAARESATEEHSRQTSKMKRNLPLRQMEKCPEILRELETLTEVGECDLTAAGRGGGRAFQTTGNSLTLACSHLGFLGFCQRQYEKC